MINLSKEILNQSSRDICYYSYLLSKSTDNQLILNKKDKTKFKNSLALHSFHPRYINRPYNKKYFTLYETLLKLNDLNLLNFHNKNEPYSDWHLTFNQSNNYLKIPKRLFTVLMPTLGNYTYTHFIVFSYLIQNQKYTLKSLANDFFRKEHANTKELELILNYLSGLKLIKISQQNDIIKIIPNHILILNYTANDFYKHRKIS